MKETIVTLPGDIADQVELLAMVAVGQVQADFPGTRAADWLTEHLSGEPGDFEISFRIMRISKEGIT